MEDDILSEAVVCEECTWPEREQHSAPATVEDAWEHATETGHGVRISTMKRITTYILPRTQELQQ